MAVTVSSCLDFIIIEKLIKEIRFKIISCKETEESGVPLILICQKISHEMNKLRRGNLI